MKAKKKTEEVNQGNIFAELKSKIEVQRNRHPEEADFSKRIRKLVLRSLREGVSSNKLGEALGISGRAIRYWQKSVPQINKKLKNKKNNKIKKVQVKTARVLKRSLTPRELKLTEEDKVLPLFEETSQDRAKASVLLCSGVKIEIELSALDSDFLIRLNQLGGASCYRH
jgi:hypothetical protein